MAYTPLLLQLVVILGTARLLGLALRAFGQPPVIGEMAAGLVLGPVVLGALAPAWHAQLFAPATLPALNSLSEIGLVLFMFIVGAELRMPTGARRRLIAASWIGVGSVVIPMGLGLGVAVLLHKSLAPPGVGFWPFALFMASAMSITAFPIMARILKERSMTHTELGQLSLASAAIADVLAWIMLALVIVLAGSKQDWAHFTRLVLGTIFIAAVIFGICRPLFARLIASHAPEGNLRSGLLALLLIATFAFAYATSYLGVHPVFGAFLFGACLPRDNRLLKALIDRVETLAVVALMPIFFALAGLSTTSKAFVGASFGALALILAAAVVGKVLGSAVGARAAGYSWRMSLSVGSLMNARALMELIVMKVGIDIGVIGPELFTMLLVMALLTTVMTGPALSLLAPASQRRQLDPLPAVTAHSER